MGFYARFIGKEIRLGSSRYDPATKWQIIIQMPECHVLFITPFVFYFLFNNLLYIRRKVLFRKQILINNIPIQSFTNKH